jgi:protein farnesyltransferase subunit beta
MRRVRTRAQFIRSTNPDGQNHQRRQQPGHRQQTHTMLPQDDDLADIFSIPSHFRTLPPLRDEVVSATSIAQDETIDECLPLLAVALDARENPLAFNQFGIPKLRVEDHAEFLRNNLARFPARAVGLDASRPWLVYWGLMGLHFLGENIAFARSRCVAM